MKMRWARSFSSMIKLNAGSLKALPATWTAPKYTLDSREVGIVHLGVGNFHRAHQAVYTDGILAQDPKWGICGVGLLPQDAAMSNALNSQDGLYSLTTRCFDGESNTQVVGSIVKHILAPDSKKDVMDVLCSDSTMIVSLTVTEKGYFLDTVTRKLDTKNPLVSADILNVQQNVAPQTAVGFIVGALKQRMEGGATGFTVLSCDNLQGNGELTERMVLDFANAVDPSLSKWIEAKASFPNSMVDRITPGTTPKDFEHTKSDGVEDKAPVASEDWIQWIIEDDFVGGRPKWEEVGALFVPDVLPYELMKLRLLNGSHTALSYVSFLLGHRLVHEALADPLVHKFLSVYMGQVTPTVPEVPGIDLVDYKAALLRRFANPSVCDQVARLCQDGSTKMPVFVGPVIQALLEAQVEMKEMEALAVCVAGWLRYLEATDEEGRPIEIDDPMQNQLVSLAQSCSGNQYDPSELLHLIYGKDVANSHFKVLVQQAWKGMRSQGMAAFLAQKF